MWILLTAANHMSRDLKIEDVASFPCHAVGDLLGELFRIPRLPAPFGQKVVGKVARIVVISRRELDCFIVKSARFSHLPALVLGHLLHGGVPLWTFRGN